MNQTTEKKITKAKCVKSDNGSLIKLEAGKEYDVESYGEDWIGVHMPEHPRKVLYFDSLCFQIIKEN